MKDTHHGGWAVVHFYHGCCRLVDALDEHGGRDVCDCGDCEQLRGLLYMAKVLTSGLESMLKGSKVIRKARERLYL